VDDCFHDRLSLVGAFWQGAAIHSNPVRAHNADARGTRPAWNDGRPSWYAWNESNAGATTGPVDQAMMHSMQKMQQDMMGKPLTGNTDQS
jgi:hypothetical protein